MTKTQASKGYHALWIVFSLVLLFNPSIHVFDILPDFIAYFILAKLCERPSDIAPYFDEARATLRKLGWLSLLKIPAFLIISLTGFGKGDTTALFALGFGIGDLILSVMAVRYLFDAIFYLGERTDKDALTSAFFVSRKKRMMPEAFRALTYFFVCVKSLIATLPEFLLLTEVSDSGVASSANMRLYPTVLLLSQALGYTLGILWLWRAIRYAKHITADGVLSGAIGMLQSYDTALLYESKLRMRTLLTSFTVISTAAFFTFSIRPDGFGGANMIPAFLFPLLTLYAITLAKRYYIGSSGVSERRTAQAVLFAISATLASFLHYLYSIYFFDTYGISELLFNDKAIAAYTPLLILSLIECIATILLLATLIRLYARFITENTGILPSSEHYRSTDRDFHNALKRRAIFTFGIGILHSLAKLADTVIYRFPKYIAASSADTSASAILSPALEWFGVVLGILSVGFIISVFLFFSMLRDEIRMKYENK